ncbi:oligosaccharide flippase family protein [Haloferax sp. ATB1]|uniref:oligosaccharide flippase family protein n=1 Tax=Haloferax sp. ATB1 TaxID=1508454 RepID=UPI0009E3C422
MAFVLSIFALLIPIQTINKILIASFNSIKNMTYRVIMKDILNPLSRIIAIIILISAGFGIAGLISGYLLGVVFSVFIGLILFVYEADWFTHSETDQISNRDLLSYSLPLVLTGAIYALVGQIDYFVIGYYIGSTEVGQYQIGFILASNILIGLQAITPVFKPIIAENIHNTKIIESQFKLSTRWVTILTIPPALTLALAPDPYLSILFTNQYTAASAAVVPLSLGYLINASFGPEGMVLEGLGHTRLTLLNTFVLVSTNGVLDLLLVPVLGVLGAGIATGTALTVAGLVGVIEIYYIRGVHPYSAQLMRVWVAIAFPLAVGIVMTSFLEGLLLIITLPVFTLISFILGLHIVGGFTSEDAKVADQFDQRIGYPVIKTLLMISMNK